MQDIFAFDVGDFGKIGLLRHLVGTTELTLRVFWWMTKLGSIANDGRHTSYLSQWRFRNADPWLWDGMRKLLPERRSVQVLHQLLPVGTTFHDVLVPSKGSRKTWLTDGLAGWGASVAPGIAFCDPDNGIDFRERTESPRHIGIDEVRYLWLAGHSLVVYHHLNRSASHQEQIQVGLRRLHHELPGLAGSWGAHFRRGSSRVFYVLPQAAHRERIAGAILTMQSTPWVLDGHFEVIESGPVTAQARSQAAVRPVIGGASWLPSGC